MKKIIGIVLIVITILSALFTLTGCQGAVRSFGGNMTLNLPENTKLEMITWKEDSLWYCTRPMRENEEAEVHTFQQSSEFGVFEGTVTIVETKGE
jgi:hypothetical protein